MLARGQRAAALGIQVDLRLMDAQHLEFLDNAFDTAVATFVFCSMPDAIVGVRELGRVVRSKGDIWLLEHMRVNRPFVGPLMDLLNSLVVRVMEANINRRTVENVQQAGLQLVSVKAMRGELVRLIHALALKRVTPPFLEGNLYLHDLLGSTQKFLTIGCHAEVVSWRGANDNTSEIGDSLDEQADQSYDRDRPSRAAVDGRVRHCRVRPRARRRFRQHDGRFGTAGFRFRRDDGQPRPAGFGGMMGGQRQSGFGGMMAGSGMMGTSGTMPADCPFVGAAATGTQGEPLTIDQAAEAAQQYLKSYNNADLKLDEVMEFDSNFYALVTEKSTGTGAFELLVDRYTDVVHPSRPQHDVEHQVRPYGERRWDDGRHDGRYAGASNKDR